jgi:hypothetical protein
VAGKQEALRQAGAAILETPIDVLAWVGKHKLR